MEIKPIIITIQTEDHTSFLINHIAENIHAANAHWWVPVSTDVTGLPNIPEKMALIHSEVSEALEGHRKSLPDDHLPHRPMVEVELADAVIRIFDLAAYLKLDIGGAMVEKIAYNKTRADHKLENRLKPGGKKY